MFLTHLYYGLKFRVLLAVDWLFPKPAGLDYRKPAPAKRLGAFTARGLFRFEVEPGRPVHVDPMDVVRRLKLHGNGDQWAESISALQGAEVMLASGDAKAKALAVERRTEAIMDLAALAKKVFGLPPLADDGAGWTDSEAFVLFTDYLEGAAAEAQAVLPLPN